jgi:serine/threonine-protein kinase
MAIAVILIGVVFWVVNLPPATIGNDLSVRVPSLEGEPYDTGAKDLTDLKLKVTPVTESSAKVSKGNIITTDPGSGAKVSRGSTVMVYVSSGKAAATVPSLTGLTEEAAKAAIAAAKLTYGTTTSDHSPTLAAGIVISSDPVPGAAAQEGDRVNLVVSDGLINIPSVVGLDISAANQELTALQLNINAVPNSKCNGLSVTAQSLTGVQPQNAAITIVYCSGG